MSYCASLYDHWMLFRIKTDILNLSRCIHYPFGSDGLADDLNFRISDRISTLVNEKKNNKKKVTSRNTYEVFRKIPKIPVFTLQIPRSMLEESAINDKDDDDDNKDRNDEDIDKEVDDFESKD
ncbi:unnamed protein product [Rhizophagus irregularis]|nr:unnamed protein product [Rhizophagus irregularis]